MTDRREPRGKCCIGDCAPLRHGHYPSSPVPRPPVHPTTSPHPYPSQAPLGGDPAVHFTYSGQLPGPAPSPVSPVNHVPIEIPRVQRGQVRSPPFEGGSMRGHEDMGKPTGGQQSQIAMRQGAVGRIWDKRPIPISPKQRSRVRWVREWVWKLRRRPHKAVVLNRRRQTPPILCPKTRLKGAQRPARFCQCASSPLPPRLLCTPGLFATRPRNG